MPDKQNLFPALSFRMGGTFLLAGFSLHNGKFHSRDGGLNDKKTLLQ
jgi:hypothetical protein